MGSYKVHLSGCRCGVFLSTAKDLYRKSIGFHASR